MNGKEHFILTGHTRRNCECDDCKANKILIIKCRQCGKDIKASKVQFSAAKCNGRGMYCKECRSKVNSNTMKSTQSQITPEKRRENALHGLSCRKTLDSEIVKKQWETIKADPELYKKVCTARIARSKKLWDNLSETEKNRRIKALTSSNGKIRSRASDRMKNMMVKNGLDQFESEQIFHGFIPDEIDHKSKTIVEFYGDLYHCNPRKYKDPNRLLKTIGRTVGEQWKRDRIRLACFYKHGYSVVIIWEKDFYKNPQGEIERIKNEINRKNDLIRTT